jgi:hypothetical protein
MLGNVLGILIETGQQNTFDRKKENDMLKSMLIEKIKMATVLTATMMGLAATSVMASDDCDQTCQDQLNDVRAVTAQYLQEANALVDGFLPDEECVEAPGLGAMGFHYVNLSRMNDTSVEASSPEVLLYERQAGGRMRLVGVEYFSPVIVNGQPWFGGPNDPPPAGQYNGRPTLFGHPFDGPMPGHNAHMPWHYDLHVWAWRNNPLGLFAPFNPKVGCQ